MIGRASRSARHFADALEWGENGSDHRLVGTARTVTESAQAEPDDQFVFELRSALMAEASTVLVDDPSGANAADSTSDAGLTAAGQRRGRARRPLRVLVAAAIIAVIGGGTVITSSHAMPGDVLYPVKLRVESVQSEFHRSDLSLGDYRLDRADKRLNEVSGLTDQGAEPELIATTLRRFSAESSEGASLLFSAHEADSVEEPVKKVQKFAQISAEKLEEIRTSVPDGAFDAYRDAQATLDSLIGQISTVCADCDPETIDSLRSSVSDLADDDPADPQEPKPEQSAPNSVPGSTTSPDPSESRNRSGGTDSSSGSQDSTSPGRGNNTDSEHPKRSAKSPSDQESSKPSGLLDPVTGIVESLLG